MPIDRILNSKKKSNSKVRKTEREGEH